MTIKENDFFLAVKSMFFLLKENIAFVKYSKLLNLMAEVGALSKVGDMPKNANLRGEIIKSEIIAALGNY